MDFSTSKTSRKTLPCISSLKFEDKISDIDTILEDVVVDPKPAKSMGPCQCSMGDYPTPSIYDGSCQKVLKCSMKKFNEKRQAYCEALEMEDVDITDRDQKYEDEMPEDDTEMEDVNIIDRDQKYEDEMPEDDTEMEDVEEGEEIEEPTTDDEIKEPVEKLTKKQAKWMQHHSQRNSKFCKDYCTSLSPAFKSEHPNSLQWRGCTPANGFLNGRNGMYTDASNKKVDVSKLEGRFNLFFCF